MLHKNYQLSILILTIAGMLTFAPQTLAAGIHWPTVNKPLNCHYTMLGGANGNFGMVFDQPWDFHNFNDGNRLARGRYDGFEIPNTSNVFAPDVKTVLAYKPNEIDQPDVGTTFELTMPDRNAQCKDYKVVKQLQGWVCKETHTARNCEGDGLENLLVQTCIGYRPLTDCR